MYDALLHGTVVRCLWLCVFAWDASAVRVLRIAYCVVRVAFLAILASAKRENSNAHKDEETRGATVEE